MVNEELRKLVDKYYYIEEDIDKEIAKLPRYGESCNCDRPVTFKEIHEGEFDEIVTTCLECGGTID